MKNHINIGFIGYGNIAQAIAKGLIDVGGYDNNKIFASAGNFDKLCKNAEKLGIKALKSVEQVARQSDLVIIAVKPYQIESVVAPVVDLLESKIIISVAATYTFEKYEKILNAGTSHISTIPNTPISVGEGVIICEKKHSLRPEELVIFSDIFEKIAILEFIDSDYLSVAGTLSGCTPAYTAMYLEALADAGVKHGLTRDAAYRLVAKMLCGTGRLYLENEVHPGIMKDNVCSPGGDTIKGVASLEKSGFRGAIIEAIDAVESR
ncbi:MAG: pyrroline-5-carboxylate reductase [Eubacteriales bacterium]|nr:pyrroline-5-carboxylate reductase [Eubacteriales bacterium]MDD4389846.1 pyrroline-5-carboxylate reductase [Eubacteriales bacterium]